MYENKFKKYQYNFIGFKNGKIKFIIKADDRYNVGRSKSKFQIIVK
jgi:hypothetical protein